ncbi:MAG: PstS family phosphate ABC transporter substrate-binding protein [Holophagaceae bacterium]
MFQFHPKTLFSAILVASASLALHSQDKVDPKLKLYEVKPGISGNLNSVGSDTLNNLMTLWVEGFNKKYPNTKIQVEGKGSATAPPALSSGTSQLGPMSRKMKSEEAAPFSLRFGYEPTDIAVAIDALAIFVNKNNPLDEISLEEADAIFSKTRLRGNSDITSWGQLNLKKDFSNASISTYGRNSASGTYGYFKEHTLNKGDFKDTVKEQPGSSSVIQGVENDRFGIGYSGIGYITSGVKALKLSQSGRWNGESFAPAYANTLNGKYPLSRFLYIYVNRNPKAALDPLVLEFISYVLSKEGQEIVVKDGYYPLPASIADRELKKLKK